MKILMKHSCFITIVFLFCFAGSSVFAANSVSFSEKRFAATNDVLDDGAVCAEEDGHTMESAYEDPSEK